MKFTFLTALSLWLALFLYGETLPVSAYIIDNRNDPIAGALVTDGLLSTFSAEDGSFFLPVRSDSLFIHHIGYQVLSLSIFNVPDYIILQKETVTLPTVTVTESAIDIFSAPPDRIRLPLDPDRHYYSTGEMLSSTPSVHSNDVQLKGENQNISILGNLARHSLIVLDGVPLNPDGESYDLSLIDPENIASIELIKNNASAYGGGSAIGGIVQITSRQSALRLGEQVSLSTELGSFGYAKNSLSYGTARQNWNLRLNFSNLATENDFSFKVPDWWAEDSIAVRANNAKRQNSLSAVLGARLGSMRLSLQSDYSGFRRQLPGTVNFTDVYLHAFIKGYANRNRLSLHAPLLGMDNQTMLWFNLDSTLYDNTRAPLTVYLSKYRQKLSSLGLRSVLGKELTLSNSLSWNAGLAAEAGLDHYLNLNLLTADQDLDHTSRNVNASLKTGLKLDSGSLIWTGSGALRYDLTDGESNPSWRVESSLQHFGFIETNLGGTYGTSFSRPSPYDLYWKGDSQALGNPDLLSEVSQGWQLWLENSLGAFNLKTSYHRNDIDNLIQWRQIQMFGNVWKPVNIGKASIQNLELEASIDALDWLTLSGKALYTKALDLSSLPVDSAPELMYTPDLSYSLELQTHWSRLSCWSRYSYTGRQWITPDNLTAPLASYALLDLGASYDLPLRDWTLSPFFSIHNLLNSRYEVYAYVPQPGISFYAGLSLKTKD